MELDDSIRPQKVIIYRGGTPRDGRRLGRNPRHRRPYCLGRQDAWPMGWAYLTQEEAQRTIEPNTLNNSTQHPWPWRIAVPRAAVACRSSRGKARGTSEK
jgi:hypothetical protein